MITRALLFAAAFGALQLAWQSVAGTSVGHAVIDGGIVAPAALIGQILTPHLGVHAVGHQLRGPAGGINIVNGCDGTETLFLLVAGFLVAPLPWGSRLKGIAAGVPLVYVLSLVRILALFYAHQTDLGLFDLLHGIVTPVLMVLSIAVFYYFWLRRGGGPALGAPP
jgi:exosortase/archaeosortase family protein